MKKIIFVISLILFLIVLLDYFFDRYTLEFNLPIKIVERKITPHIKKETPSQKKANNGQILPYQTISNNKIEEDNTPTIKEYPKFLTEKSFNLRKEILSYLEKKIKSKNELIAFDNILKKESGYNPESLNEIGAGGLCQAYPYQKMNCQLSYKDWQCQVDWCLKYIENRYKNPIEAWKFHIINNWF